MPASAPASVAGKHLAYITEKEAKLLEVLNLHDSTPANDFKYQPPGGKPQEDFVLANKKEQKNLKAKGATGRKTAAGVKSFYMETTGGTSGTSGIGTSSSGGSSAGKTSGGMAGGPNAGGNAGGAQTGGGGSQGSQGSNGGTGDRGTPGMNQGSNGFRGGTSQGTDSKGTGARGTPGMNQGSNGFKGGNTPGSPTTSGEGKGGRLEGPRTDRAPSAPVGGDTLSGPGKVNREEGPRMDRMPAPPRNTTTINETPNRNVTNINKSPGVAAPLSQQPYASFTQPKTPEPRDDRMPTTPVSSLSKLATVSAPRTDRAPAGTNPGTSQLAGLTPSAPSGPSSVPGAVKDPSRLPQDPNAARQITAQYPNRPITVAAQNTPNVPRSDRMGAGNDVSQAQVDAENAAYTNAGQNMNIPAKDTGRLPQSNTADNSQVSDITESAGPGEGNLTQATYNPPAAPSGLRPGETAASSQLATSYLNNQNLTNPGGLVDASDTGGNGGQPVSDLPSIIPPVVEEPPPVDPLPPPAETGGPPVVGSGGTGPVVGSGGLETPTPGDPPPEPTDPGPGIVDPYAGIMPWDREAYASLQAIMQTMGVTYTPDQFVAQFYQQGNEAAPPPINYVRPKVQPIPVESGQPLVQEGV